METLRLRQEIFGWRSARISALLCVWRKWLVEHVLMMFWQRISSRSWSRSWCSCQNDGWHDHSRPIRGKYPSNVITISQSEASIQVTWSESANQRPHDFSESEPIRGQYPSHVISLSANQRPHDHSHQLEGNVQVTWSVSANQKLLLVDDGWREEETGDMSNTTLEEYHISHPYVAWGTFQKYLIH